MFRSRGFTLIEVLVVMGLIALLTGLSVISLLGSQRLAVSDSASNALVADLRSQQIKAMMGDGDGGASAQPYGVFFGTTSYTLFTGSSYVANNPANFVVDLKGLTISSTFPASTVLFTKASGEVTGFTAGQNTITFANGSGQQTVVNVNRFGVVNVQ